MFKSFMEIEKYILDNGIKKKIALAASQDNDALQSVLNAVKKGVVSAVLIGDVSATKALMQEMGYDDAGIEFVEEKDGAKAAALACKMVKEKQADMPMKGLMHTSSFMRAILDKEKGFVPEKGLLSQATVLEYTHENRMLIITDCAVNITPDYQGKFKLIENAVGLAHKLNNPCPKVAVLAPVEVINPAMPETIEGAMLSKAAERGQLKGCIVDGPLALDVAVSKEAAAHKGVKGEVAGQADILIMPDLAAGNIFTKSLTYFAQLPSSGTLVGTSSPVIMTSRSDTPENKYNSILTAILQSL